jgi:hypothetical protein
MKKYKFPKRIKMEMMEIKTKVLGVVMPTCSPS